MTRPDHGRLSAPRPGHQEDDRRAAAAYVAALAAELRAMAQKNGLPTLAYLLDMAHIEASTEARDKSDEPAGSAPAVQRP